DELYWHDGGEDAAGVPFPPTGRGAGPRLPPPQAHRPARIRWRRHRGRRPQQVRAMGPSRGGVRGRQGVVLLQPARPQVRHRPAHQPRHALRLLEGHRQGPRHPRPRRRRRVGGDAQDARLLPGQGPQGDEDGVGHARVPPGGGTAPPPPAAEGREDWVLCRVFYKSRTTSPRPPSDEACTFFSELDLPTMPPLAPLINAYIAFDSGTAMNTIEQVSCFSGLPALPLRGSMSFGDLLGWDNPEKKAIRTALSNMSSNSNSKLELTPNWSQENGLSQMWT
uniref:NAC domain-containing protein n=1 Tax=Aegilops tauschii subsp. strangulata TaxID=200361 RepID=A0A453RZ42_AEGTS